MKDMRAAEGIDDGIMLPVVLLGAVVEGEEEVVGCLEGWEEVVADAAALTAEARRL
jgi:hypothetical protein